MPVVRVLPLALAVALLTLSACGDENLSLCDGCDTSTPTPTLSVTPTATSTSATPTTTPTP